MAAAIDVSLAIGMDKIEKLCSYFGRILQKRLVAMNGVNIYHYNDQNMCGIVTFSCDAQASTIKERLQIMGAAFILVLYRQLPRRWTPLAQG